MITVLAGNSVSQSLEPGEQLLVTLAAGGAGFVDRFGGTEMIDQTELADTITTFGPYLQPMRLVVSCDAESASFAVQDNTDAVNGVVLPAWLTRVLAASDGGATSMLISADGLTNMVLLKTVKVTVDAVDYYLPLFGAD